MGARGCTHLPVSRPHSQKSNRQQVRKVHEYTRQITKSDVWHKGFASPLRRRGLHGFRLTGLLVYPRVLHHADGIHSWPTLPPIYLFFKSPRAPHSTDPGALAQNKSLCSCSVQFGRQDPRARAIASPSRLGRRRRLAGRREAGTRRDIETAGTRARACAACDGSAAQPDFAPFPRSIRASRCFAWSQRRLEARVQFFAHARRVQGLKGKPWWKFFL